MKRFWTETLPHLSGRLSANMGAFVLASLLAFDAQAQDTKSPASSPVGGTWESNVNISNNDKSSQTLSPEQVNALNVVNSYFNEFINLQGRFTQIDPDQKKTRGKFFVQKPGKFRFDYASPSKKIIISDGKFLAIQDLDLRNEDVYKLKNTPFRILLKKGVNIFKDARIFEITNKEEQITVTLADKDPDTAGLITILIGLQPEPTLLGWTTADAQGQKTIISVSDVSKPEKLDGKLFKREKLFTDAAKPD